MWSIKQKNQNDMDKIEMQKKDKGFVKLKRESKCAKLFATLEEVLRQKNETYLSSTDTAHCSMRLGD